MEKITPPTLAEDRMMCLDQAADRYAGRYWYDRPDDKRVASMGFRAGAIWMSREIKRQIDFAAVEKYDFPILHILDFIDKTIGEKE